MNFAERLDFNVAWIRAKVDLDDWCFVNHPFDIDLVEMDLDGWSDLIRKQVANGSYEPGPGPR